MARKAARGKRKTAWESWSAQSVASKPPGMRHRQSKKNQGGGKKERGGYKRGSGNKSGVTGRDLTSLGNRMAGEERREGSNT